MLAPPLGEASPLPCARGVEDNFLVRLRRADVIFFAFFGIAVTSALVWLFLGGLPALSAAVDGLHGRFHEWGLGEGVVAEMARNVAQTSHGVGSPWQSLLDFVFSAINIGLAILVLRLRPHDRTARLLALGMTGVAVAFNLRGHDAFQVIPVSLLGEVDIWHVLVHVLSGLCYLFALLLFPDGRLAPRSPLMTAARTPLLMFVALIFTMFALISTDDHTLGLVLVFGILVPIAGLAAQVGRYRRAPNDAARRQSRLLLWALALVFVVTPPLLILTAPTEQGERSETVSYEIQTPAAGSYFFTCDPHPVDMRGTLIVSDDPAAPSHAALSARDNKFDTNTLTLIAGTRSVIDFTSFDADLHNVAIYSDATAQDPIFIGAEFSGVATAALAFRVCRLIFGAIPIALIVGLVRFHLWDIDRIVNRALVYGIVAGAITVAYVGIIVGIGALVGAGSELDIVLVVFLTAVVAVAFQPLRERARRFADRLIYGKRASPYEVLSEFADKVGQAYAVDEVLPRMAKAIAEGTGAARAEVWLRVGGDLVRSASWPEDHSAAPARKEVLDGRLPEFSGADRAVPVAHHEELLGAVTVEKPPGEHITPVEDDLLAGVANQAGLVLKNAQLAAELNARIEELRASRQRIVSAQDAERRRIERNIHDGAQQHLVALGMKLRMAQELTAREPDRAMELLNEIQHDTGAALQTLRDLARGIYPPILADKGLGQALDAHARRCPVVVAVEAEGLGRYSPEVEAAVYFCCLEAIQNAIKHARGPIEVSLRDQREKLTFSIRDQGPGFDVANAIMGFGLQNMRDRVSALGGELDINSRPGARTKVSGWMPGT